MNYFLSRTGVFIETFDIHKITSVKPTRTILSSPAASLDRIEVRAGRRSVVISPRSKYQFVKQLLDINPSIDVIGLLS